MGFAPPEDGPAPPDTPPEPPTPPNLSIGVAPSGPLLCGFGIPGVKIGIKFKIPALNFDFPPALDFTIALKCNLSDPIDASFGPGGGRQGDKDLDKDPEDT